MGGDKGSNGGELRNKSRTNGERLVKRGKGEENMEAVKDGRAKRKGREGET